MLGQPIRLARRGFTLIELLVVIAIIAILAAILFPVFSQAKLAAKKTQAISNVKNLATATMIYTSDNDDYFPLTNIFNPQNGLTSYNRFVPTPQTLAANYVNAVGLDAIGSFYTNSLRTYIKSEDIWDDPTGVSTTSVYTLSIANGMPYSGGKNYAYAMNGLLNSYSTTAVNSPSNLIAFSQDGKRKVPGAWFANPAMGCLDTTSACVYTPGTSDCATTKNGSTSFWSRSTGGAGFDTYAGQWVVSYADGHAKTRKITPKSTGTTDPRVEFIAKWNGQDGSVSSSGIKRYFSGPAAGGCHAYMFRPDLDFQTWDTAIIEP